MLTENVQILKRKSLSGTSFCDSKLEVMEVWSAVVNDGYQRLGS